MRVRAPHGRPPDDHDPRAAVGAEVRSPDNETPRPHGRGVLRLGEVAKGANRDRERSVLHFQHNETAWAIFLRAPAVLGASEGFKEFVCRSFEMPGQFPNDVATPLQSGNVARKFDIRARRGLAQADVAG